MNRELTVDCEDALELVGLPADGLWPLIERVVASADRQAFARRAARAR
jgi:hypothetical protein